jgi:hypothetical protein
LLQIFISYFSLSLIPTNITIFFFFSFKHIGGEGRTYKLWERTSPGGRHPEEDTYCTIKKQTFFEI